VLFFLFAADIDSGFRGYALMHQSMFLAPMVAAEAELPQAMQRLSDLTIDTPSLQGGVQVLRRRLDELVNTKRQLTLQIEDGKQEKALASLRTGDGVALSKMVANAFDDLDMKIDRECKDLDLSQAEKQTKAMWQLVAAQAGVMFIGVLVLPRSPYPSDRKFRNSWFPHEMEGAMLVHDVMSTWVVTAK
jgi:CHASE3 domain sensor protein